jgi:PAS domain S-box-containing protein
VQEKSTEAFGDFAERERLKEEARRLGEYLEGRSARLEAVNAQLKNKEQMLREAEEHHRMVTEEISDGIWEYEARTGELYWNDRHFEILGLSRSEFVPTLEGFLELVHPEDRRQFLARATTARPAHDEPFTIELRMRHSTGEYRYCIIRVREKRDPDGALLRVTGIVIDITELRPISPSSGGPRRRCARASNDSKLPSNTPRSGWLWWGKTAVGCKLIAPCARSLATRRRSC